MIKSIWKKIWYFIWEDDSVLSWLVNVVIAFIFIKFIVYPVLAFAFSTPYPIVAVVSTSMEHDGGFDDWWSSQANCPNSCSQLEFYGQNNISKDIFQTFIFKNGFNKGDIMFLHGSKPENIVIGDVIVFNGYKSDPIIHRVIKKWKKDEIFHYTTKGDHNKAIHMGVGENDITEDRIIGKAFIRLPFFGWIKILFVKFLSFIG